MKTNYYYIDEAGGVDNNSEFFILGCYKTDTPEEIRLSLLQLREKILNTAYFAGERAKFLKEGFHATKNHPDIWSRFYSMLATMNIRAYVLLVKKQSNLYQEFIKEGLTSLEIYNVCIKKLLFDRLTKTRYEKNHLIFEEYGSKPQGWLTNLVQITSEISTDIHGIHGVNPNPNVEVHDKSDINLSVIDYINFLFIQLLEGSNLRERMLQNFTILEPKIGLIYKFDKDQYFDRTKRIDITKY